MRTHPRSLPSWSARRALLAPALVVFLLAAAIPAGAETNALATLPARLAALEKSAHGRLGLAVLDTGTGRRFGYRDRERFPLCSTFKLVLAAAILEKSQADPALLAKHVRYAEPELLAWAPVTRQYLAQGLDVAALCAAALQYSDNTAANLLLRELGGPRALTAFARRLGDTAFRLDRPEPELNSAIPNDPRDTTTPAAMAATTAKLVLGRALAPAKREQLARWLQGNTTGNESIRAGVPAGWIVGDKTGSGAYGTTNDVAVLWPPKGAPLVLAVYFTQPDKDAPSRKDVLASATRLVLEAMRGGER